MGCLSVYHLEPDLLNNLQPFGALYIYLDF